jgi:hypothetical protein
VAKDEPGLFGIGIGFIRKLDDRFELLGSAGPVFESNRTDITYYVAIGWHG